MQMKLGVHAQWLVLLSIDYFQIFIVLQDDIHLHVSVITLQKMNTLGYEALLCSSYSSTCLQQISIYFMIWTISLGCEADI